MTYEVALENIQRVLNDSSSQPTSLKGTAELEIAVAAIEKLIPTNTILLQGHRHHCPSCKTFLGFHRNNLTPCCPCCGQAVIKSKIM